MNMPNDPFGVFLTRTERLTPDQCWTWLGGTNRQGYGTVWIRGKLKKAAHLSLEFHGKPRPKGALALHSCDNPICVNPHHLRWGTHQDNADDKVRRGRWRGGDPKLLSTFKATPEVIKEVLASAETGGELSRRLGISKPVINRIRREHGVSRRCGRHPTMAERVWEYMNKLAGDNGIVEIRQTVAASALGLATSNINIAIKWLCSKGRVERVTQGKQRIWTYRVIRVT